MVIDLHAIRTGNVEMLWYRWLCQGEWIELGNPVFAAAGDAVLLFSADGVTTQVPPGRLA